MYINVLMMFRHRSLPWTRWSVKPHATCFNIILRSVHRSYNDILHPNVVNIVPLWIYSMDKLQFLLPGITPLSYLTLLHVSAASTGYHGVYVHRVKDKSAYRCLYLQACNKNLSLVFVNIKMMKLITFWKPQFFVLIFEDKIFFPTTYIWLKHFILNYLIAKNNICIQI